MKELRSKEAAKVAQEEEQPILGGMKLIGAGPVGGLAPQATGYAGGYY